MRRGNQPRQSPSTSGRRRWRRCRQRKSSTAVTRSGTRVRSRGVAAATPERRSIWRVGSESTWTTVVPVVFIIASLLSLVVLPIVFSSHTARMRQEITRVAEPARRAANEIQMDLSAEVDRLMAFQVTGQSQYRDQYLKRIEAQRRNYDTLRKLGPQLGVDVGARLNDLVKQGSEWHEGVQKGEFIGRVLPAEVFMQRLFEQHLSYERALHASAALETAIQESIDERLSKIRDTERLNVSLTLILAILALTSALLVAGLGRQMRLLASEAMRRRQEAEREAADAKIARAGAERAELRERQARVIGAAPALVRYLGAEDQPLSTMAVPLVSRGQTLGVITAAAPEGKVFTREDALLTAELARRGSLAIDNARLYEESQQALRAREEVLAIVSHDLRNPLNAITLAVSLMQTSISGEEREQLEALDV